MPAGYRGVAFLTEAGSAEELGEMLTGLPFWRINRWTVTPLQSFDSALARQQGVLDRARTTS
ncbi:MAG TPA: hypothetical protein VFO65_01750 [Acidimicrobiales bacterium]|nr:hypothetical protein [Acidimicrobiales bacterium]